MSTPDEIHAVLSQWTAAEIAGDTAAMQTLIAEDFTGIGPLGFTLSKQDWLDRHRDGRLSYETFELQDLQLRTHTDAAVAIAVQSTQGSYQGHPVPTALRVTVVLTQAEGDWQLAVVHMSFIAGTSGSPPIPGRE